MRIIRIFFSILVLFIFVQSLSALRRVVTGTVIDKTNGEHMIGGNIYVVNEADRTLSGTIVSSNGEYRLVLPEGDNLTIVFSFIGFETERVPYDGQEVIDAELQEKEMVLEGTDVVAQRIERNQMGLTDREIVTSTQKISTEMLEDAPVLSIEEALQGRMSNVGSAE